MGLLTGVARDQFGAIATNASITVYLTGTTTPASLFEEEALTTPVANPVSVDAVGQFQVHVADGLFDYAIARPGETPQTVIGVAAINPSNYLALAGRAGGQVAYGGTGSGNPLTFRSTSHGTKGPMTFEQASGYVFNEDGAAVDFRVEGDTVANLLFLQGSTDRVGIGTATPSARFNVEGGGVIFNDAGGDFDVRMEGDTEANLFFLDASVDRIGVGTSAPTHRVDVRVSATGSTVGRVQNTHASGFSGFSFYDESGVETFIIAVDNGSNVSRINSVNSHPIGLFTGSVERVAIGASGDFIFNDPGNNCDFRVEGDTDQFLIFADASADCLGIGSSAPGAKLHVKSSGVVSILEGTGTESQFLWTSNSGGTPQTWMLRLTGATPSFTIRDSTAGTEPFGIQVGAANTTMFIGVNRNIVFCAGAVTSGVGVIGIGGNATAPSTSPADTVQLWVADAAAGDAQLFVRNEAGKHERLSGLVVRNSAQFDKTSDTTLANVTGLTHNVEAGKAYRFTARLPTASNAAGGVKAAIAGTCTATAITYEGLTIAAGATTQGRGTALGTAVGGVTAVTAAWIEISGTIVVNAAGTLTVQFAQNASFGTASSVLANGSFEIQQIG